MATGVVDLFLLFLYHHCTMDLLLWWGSRIPNHCAILRQNCPCEQTLQHHMKMWFACYWTQRADGFGLTTPLINTVNCRKSDLMEQPHEHSAFVLYLYLPDRDGDIECCRGTKLHTPTLQSIGHQPWVPKILSLVLRSAAPCVAHATSARIASNHFR